jgi:hypothetical protein
LREGCKEVTIFVGPNDAREVLEYPNVGDFVLIKGVECVDVQVAKVTIYFPNGFFSEFFQFKSKYFVFFFSKLFFGFFKSKFSLVIFFNFFRNFFFRNFSI